MRITEKQCHFGRMLALFLHWMHIRGYRFSVREVWRSREMQEIYVRQGKSKTMDSKHLLGLAVDIVLFDSQWQPMWDLKAYKELGSFWKSLDVNNRWGGDWGWDAGHFEYAG